MTFKDTFGVEYSDDRQTLLKCPTNFSGSYSVSPLVRIIGEGAFNGCSKLEDLILQEGVEVIEKDAFKGCTSLKNIVLPNSLITFKMPRLSNCDSLRELRMPDNLKTPVFVDCINIEHVYINDTNNYFCSENGVIYNTDKTILYFFPRSFEGSFVFPNSLETIYYARAISNCLKLKTLVLSESFQSFGLGNSTITLRGCTLGCSSLNTIEVNDRNNLFCSIDGVLYSKDKKTIVRCPEGKTGDYNIIDSVNEILERAFYYCKNVQKIIIPESVTKIGFRAFWGCESITHLFIPSKTTDIDVTAFPLNLNNLEIDPDNPIYYTTDSVIFKTIDTTLTRESKKTINIPVSLEWFPKAHSKNKYIVPNNVELINHEAFRDVENLTLVFRKYVPITRTSHYTYKLEWSKGRILVPIGTKQQFIEGNYPGAFIEEIWMPEVITDGDLQNKCLNFIVNNPFRVLGLCTNSTAKEVSANKTKVTRFADVGKTVDFPLDLNGLLGQCVRDKATIEIASASLSLPQEKIKYALFWFAKESPVDEMALEHVQAGNIEKAIELLGKRENWSALINRGVLSLAMGKLEDAVGSIMKVIHNDSYRGALLLSTCGEAFSMDETELSRLFVNTLKTEITEKALLSIVFEGGFIEEVDYLTDEIVNSIQSKINGEIDKTSNTNPDDAEASYQSGEALMNNTKQALEELKRILGASDMQYQSLANNVAKRILQFSINYHNAAGGAVEYEKALALAKYAESIAEGKLVKERCAENLKVMEENNIHAKIKDDEKLIIDKLNGCKNITASLKAAQQLVDNCQPSLLKIKEFLGAQNKYYLNLSSSVANCALGFLITVVNDSQKNDNDRKKLRVIGEAEKVMAAIGKLDMTPSEKIHFEQNKRTLGSIKTTLNIYKRTVWNKMTESSLFWLSVFVLGLGGVGGIIGLMAEGEFWSGFGIGCGFGAFSIFYGIFGRKK